MNTHVTPPGDTQEALYSVHLNVLGQVIQYNVWAMNRNHANVIAIQTFFREQVTVIPPDHPIVNSTVHRLMNEAEHFILSN